MKKIINYFLFILLFTPWIGSAQEKDDENTFDSIHDSVTDTLMSISSSVDFFFGGRRVDEELNGSYIRLTTSAGVREYVGTEQDFNFRLKVDLPGTEEKFKLVFEGDGDQDSNVTQDQVKDNNNPNTQSDSLNAAVRYILTKSKKFNINFDTGLRIRIGRPLNPFARIRGRRSWALTRNLEFRVVQNFYHYYRTGFLSNTTVDFDRPINESFLFRFHNNAVWSKEDEIYYFGNAFILYQKLADKKAIRYQIGANGNDEPYTTYTSYDALISYRQLLYRQWLYMTITPGIQLPRENNFRTESYLTFQFEVIMGNY